uniref:Uncharacterized protein n=1 Tax=Mus musculus TaxID=10090 RepID=A0ABJ3HNS9_MOUSE
MGKQTGAVRPQEFRCLNRSAAGIAATAGFTDACLQPAETTPNSPREHSFGSKRGKVLGTSQCHPWSPWRWWKGIKPTVAILSRGISDPAGGWRPGQGCQGKGVCRTVVWARTKPPPPKFYNLEGRRWAWP